MNPDVSGEARCVDPSDLIGGEPSFFEGFSLVIASQLQRDALLSLSAVLWSMNVPLIAVRSYGLVGSMRIARPVHVCFEAKEAQAVADLRIANPFPALQAFADAVDLKSCDDETHRHLPYPVLLVKLMGEYAAEHGGQPKTFAQRKAFAKWVGTQRRDITTDEGVPIWEENFDEAVANASKASLPTPVSATTRRPALPAPARPAAPPPMAACTPNGHDTHCLPPVPAWPARRSCAQTSPTCWPTPSWTHWSPRTTTSGSSPGLCATSGRPRAKASPFPSPPPSRT